MKGFIRALFVGIFAINVIQPVYAFRHNEKFAIKRDVGDVVLVAEVDYRFDGDDLFRQHYDVGVHVPLPFLGAGWSAAMHYRSIYSESDSGGWNLEKRPYAQLQKTFKTDSIKWATRTRQEYRIRYGRGGTTRNRSRIKVSSNQAFFDVKPFVSNEFFYDFDKDKYNKNRIDIGVDFTLPSDLNSSVYYKLVLDRDGKNWEPTSSLVFKVKF